MKYAVAVEADDTAADIRSDLQDQFNDALYHAFCKVLADNDIEHDPYKCATMFRLARFDDAIRTSTEVACKKGDAVNTLRAKAKTQTNTSQEHAGFSTRTPFVYCERGNKLSVCISNNMSPFEARVLLSKEYGKVTRSKDKTFASGEPNPCPCNDYPTTHTHIVFERVEIPTEKKA